MTIDRNPDHLHPAMAIRVRALAMDLGADTPLAIFETFRSAERQEELWRNRTTKARAWQSAHQFGLACDFAIYTGQEWGWPPVDDPLWALLALRARVHDLWCGIGWDPGHVQIRENWRA